MSDLIERYLATWNASDSATRRALLAEHWAEDARYVDPLVDVAGRDALDATIAAVREQFPGFVFTPVSAADGHHDVTRFQWGLGPDGAEPIVIGFDVVTTGADGRITTVVGFLDRVPGAASDAAAGGAAGRVPAAASGA
ncbi:nuclear transport factor 2 family protein [Cryptosporangium aurantiacum]|nr:nuclear transport factor 2 family protein [Cryptosporangium aurantiacum]